MNSRYRTSLILVGASSALLAGIWLLRDGTRPTAESRARSTPPPAVGGESVGNSSSSSVLSGSGGTRESERASQRTLVRTETSGRGDQGSVLVWGTLLDASRQSVDRGLGLDGRDPRVTMLDDSSRRVGMSSIDSEGVYRISGMTAGAWTLHADVPGYWPWTRDILLLDGERERRIDLVFEAYERLRTRIEIRFAEPVDDPFGGLTAFQDGGSGVSLLRAIVTKAAPPNVLAEGVGDENDDALTRSIRGQADFEQPDLYVREDEFELHCRLPAYVSAVVGNSVVRTERVESAENTVVLDVSPNEIDDARFGQIRFRVIDDKGQVPAGGLHLAMWRNLDWAAPLPWSASGEVHVRRLLPGPLGIEIRAHGYARTLRLAVTPGMDLDLGEVRLEPAARIRGEVVDEDGSPAWAELQCIELSRARDDASMSGLAREMYATDERGRFELPSMARGRYVLRAQDRGAIVRASGPIVVSTATGSVDGLRITLSRTIDVVVHLGGSGDSGCTVLVESEDHVPVDSSWSRNDGTCLFQLRPGRYSARAVIQGRVVAGADFDAAGGQMLVTLTPR